MNARRFSLAAALITLVAAGCAEKEPPPKPEVARPVKVQILSDKLHGEERGFPAKVESNQRATLSFHVAGTLDKILVREGDLVKQGQLLAQLDPKDFELKIAESKAAYDKAQADFSRAKELIRNGYISRSDYDQLDTTYKQARASLAQARQNLAYTSLKAPYEARVAKRYIENFEQVQANQEIFALRGEELLEISFDVPEDLLINLKQSDSPPTTTTFAWAEFPLAGDKRYPLIFKELSAQANENTQTFKATFFMEVPEVITVLPGMNAVVIVDLPKNAFIGWNLPLSALDRRSGEPQVWVFDTESRTAAPRAVRFEPDGIQTVLVTEGLNPGDTVIVAGVSELKTGMKLYPLRNYEQAELN
ncbi:Multidrug resistance protein MexA [BD1-7 clade bacterium]|uniref:Multidrug resistance protein MexA n=1 Tax=BD1-7 clade bacterium TaxID=2029982 RepID=A0A5S9Q0X5_9GAMM|nr:Multidrug resistance protein MexA [BD1-7 clade bacterium]CAA0110429.1 Multidrug resistance protein MexA [BD1-7 clade bacterium]